MFFPLFTIHKDVLSPFYKVMPCTNNKYTTAAVGMWPELLDVYKRGFVSVCPSSFETKPVKNVSHHNFKVNQLILQLSVTQQLEIIY